MKVRWLVSATVSLRAIHAQIALENSRAARRVVRAIRSSTGRLREFPESGRLGTVAGTREIIVADLPYVVLYRVTESQIEVLRVFHTATDWLGDVH